MGYTLKKEKRHMIDKNYRNFVMMNKSNHSYAINNKITSHFNHESWLGKRCFIIGGGESLTGFDFNKLNDELTISINKAFEFCPNATINYAMDSTFYDKMSRGNYDEIAPDLWNKWLSFKGYKVFLTPMEIKEFGKEVNLVRREWKPSINREDLDDGIYGGINSATGALTLAVALGANPIYLLGYDMIAKTKTHWHGGYDRRTLENFNRKLKDYKGELTKMACYIKEANIDVINLNKDSELECFPFANIEEVLCQPTEM